MPNETFAKAPCESIEIKVKEDWAAKFKRLLPIINVKFLSWEVHDLEDKIKKIQEKCKNKEITDIIILYHGLNNLPNDAEEIYLLFLKALDGSLEALDQSESKHHILKARSFLVIKIFWPSELKKSQYPQYYLFREQIQNEGGNKGKEIIDMLGKLSKEQRIRLHLIAHSSGTILLSHSLNQCKNSVLVDTVALIQSNLTRDEFKNLTVSLRQKVSGNILITYKKNDEKLTDQEDFWWVNKARLDSSNLESIGRYGAYESDCDQDLCLPIGKQEILGIILERKKIYNLNAANVMQNHDDFKTHCIAVPILKAIANNDNGT